jgi:hypothetical protein
MKKETISPILFVNLVAWVLFVFPLHFAQGQTIDINQLTADPNTLMFSDEKTRVEDYVNTVMKLRSNCCGENDQVYLQLKFLENGCIDTARVLRGKNTCINRSVEDILSQIRWTPDNPAKPSPAVFSLKVSLQPCAGGKINAYKPVPPPPGWKDCRKKAKPISTINELNPTVVTTKPEPTPTKTEPPQPVAQKFESSPTDTGAMAKLKPTVLPNPAYVSSGDKRPNQDHFSTYSNVQGPQNSIPQFLDGRGGMAIFIKTQYRKMGVCGLANVTTEITVNPDGTVKEFRLFSVNPGNNEEESKTRDAVQKATPYVLSGMRFRPVSREQFFVLQYKTHVDCPPQTPKMKESQFKQINYFFTIPDKGARPQREVPKTDTLEDPQSN